MSMLSFIIPLAAFALSLVSALQYHGADFSSLLLVESTANVQYTGSSTAAPQPLEKILYDYGVNIARIRIWTSGTYDLTYGLKLAKRAKAVGMDILIALHYSDTWADPGDQHIPSDWPTDLDGLVSQTYNYTYEVVQAFNAQETPIQLIQIGNEINDGPLWPTGRVTVNGFHPASQILHAGALAVRTASPSTKIVVHLASGWYQVGISWFLDGIFVSETEGGLGSGLTQSDVDVIGLSDYPYYGTAATLSNLNSTIGHIASTYNKDIIIVETGWPAVCDTGTTQLSEPAIPVGVKGQISWIEDIVAILNSVNLDHGGKALGIVYFEPGWVGNAALGSGCSDILLVTSDGVARESMTIFSSM
ncbi:glycoside hydrolase family 53 protein [Boletus edulis BED1]|uniref:Arabinogalactan endo-beta-1,4-galactanase n=1 Tax=Boletus edulis BED1 TaxID=1328754 RepID=A0AAD4BV07_BOLED|nr:glycoside hydrolase family 53 protein [Boletus edulis BED1]